MNSFIKYILISGFLILFYQSSFSQDLQMPYIKAESIYRGEDSIITWTTRSIPPRYGKRADGYKFDILLHIKFPNDSRFLNGLFDVIYQLPQNKR